MEYRYSSYLQIFGILIILITLGACAPLSQVNLLDPVTRNTVLTADQGYVVARVVNAGAVQLPFNYLTINPVNLNAEAEIKPDRLTAIGTISGNTTLFVSPVNAGKYSLSGIRSYYSQGETWYSRSASAGIENGTFQVTPGNVTDLGTIIYYPRVDGDRYFEKILRSPDSASINIIEGNLPFLSFDQTLGWTEDEATEERETAYASAVQNPVAFNKAFRSTDGTLFFIGKLGAILIRKTDGEWDTDAVDTDSDLFAIAEGKNGDMAVGGEHGAIFFKRDGNDWRPIEFDVRYTIVGFSFVGREALDVIAKKGDEVRIFRVDINSDKMETKSMAYYRYYDGWFDEKGNTQNAGKKSSNNALLYLVDDVSIRDHDGTSYFYIDVQFGKNYSPYNRISTQHFTFDPRSWKFNEPSGSSKGIDAILNAGALNIGIKKAGMWSFTGKSSYYAYNEKTKDWDKMGRKVDWCPELDNATSFCKWEKRTINRISTFDFLSVPVFSDSTNAVAFVKYSGYSMSGSRREFNKAAMIKTTDRGKTWNLLKAELPSEYCHDTIPEAKNMLLVSCQGISSDFYQSNDEGNTWQHVREHQNF